jgi:hypothetical protein
MVQKTFFSLSKTFFVCFNAMMFVFGLFLGHGTTDIKKMFFKVTVATVTMLITLGGEKSTYL